MCLEPSKPSPFMASRLAFLSSLVSMDSQLSVICRMTGINSAQSISRNVSKLSRKGCSFQTEGTR